MKTLAKIKEMLDIWHKTSDELPTSGKVLFETLSGCYYVGDYILGDFRAHLSVWSRDDVERWCYIQDILNITEND